MKDPHPKVTLDELEEVIDGEINHAIATLQKSIGQTDGGIAGEHFCGQAWYDFRRYMIRFFADWLETEHHCSLDPQLQENVLDALDLEKALQKSMAWEVELTLMRHKNRALKDRQHPYPEMNEVLKDLQEIYFRYQAFWGVESGSPYSVNVTHGDDKFELFIGDQWSSAHLTWCSVDHAWFIGDSMEEVHAYGWNLTNWQAVGRGDTHDL